MCGRFTLKALPAELVELFSADAAPDFTVTPRYNLAPSQAAVVVRPAASDGHREMVTMRWGLTPSWAKPKGDDKFEAYPNARSETVATKPAYRSPFKRRRCLMAADGLFEWRLENGGKQPYYFRRKDGMPFGVAAIWDHHPVAGVGCAMLLPDAKALMAQIHDRMPVILSPGDYARWLDTAATVDDLQALMVPADPAGWESYPVGKSVNYAKNEGPELTEPLASRKPEGSLFG
jgi:putative SOS response-associated peptidase YedK